jgi:hypothetical protein
MADEVLSTVVGKIHVSGKAPARLFEATGPALQPLPVMMATALLVQLVQVRTPALDMQPDGNALESTPVAACHVQVRESWRCKQTKCT